MTYAVSKESAGVTKQLKQWLSESRELLGQILAAFSEWAGTPDGKAQLGHLQSVLGFIAVLVLIGASIAALFYLPSWYVNQSVGGVVRETPLRAFELENETRKTLTQIILGIFGLLVLYFTWRRVKAGDKTAAVAEQGHLTDRYTRAIEQLGKLENGEPHLEIRLGGIYALERIAIDSPRDQQTIMEVLCAYVRRNAVPPPAPPPTQPPAGESSADIPPQKEKPRIDIQAILTVIGRRQRGNRREKKPFRIDLGGAYLNGADVSFAHLEEVNLSRAYLRGASLIGATLNRASFDSAHLEGASLMLTHLEDARFVGSHLESANLNGAHMERAILINANMVQADLWGTHLNGAFLVSARMERASLSEAQLDGALLRNTVLEGALLWGTRLEGAINLTVDQVKSARNWETAHYAPAFRRELGLPDPPA